MLGKLPEHRNRDYFSVIHNDSSSPFWEKEEEHKALNEKLDAWIEVPDYGGSACIVIHLVINSNYQPKRDIRHV